MAKRGTNDEVIEDDLDGDCVSEGAAVVVSITPLLTLDEPKNVKMIWAMGM